MVPVQSGLAPAKVTELPGMRPHRGEGLATWPEIDAAIFVVCLCSSQCAAKSWSKKSTREMHDTTALAGVSDMMRNYKLRFLLSFCFFPPFSLLSGFFPSLLSSLGVSYLPMKAACSTCVPCR